MMLRKWDGESYCARACGRPAVVEQPLGMAGPVPVIELLCYDCAEAESDLGELG